jgi:hypothetical protein
MDDPFLNPDPSFPSQGGRSIVFTDTKADANDLAVTLSDGG